MSLLSLCGVVSCCMGWVIVIVYIVVAVVCFLVIFGAR